ncbi:hypothetical protein LZ30DRAFT_3645 [Colletotrichum cereale]|nr:hypothetical protein LZ30DRAFT_3645 [Colletotrichum cereale]
MAKFSSSAPQPLFALSLAVTSEGMLFRRTERYGMPPSKRTGYGLWIPPPLRRIILLLDTRVCIVPRCSMHTGPGGCLPPHPEQNGFLSPVSL